MGWQIKGQAGKALDTTPRSFETLRIDAAQLRFQSLAPDTLTWTAATDNATGAGTTVPEAGQVVELFLDGSRKFYGHAMRPQIGPKSVTVEIQGPWWWMQQIYLTNQALSGSADDRAQYVFGTGDIGLMIRQLIDRGIGNGVPMIRGGSFPEMYDFTRVTLSNMTIADALAKMLARVPDSVAWFNYTAATGVYPSLRISRRNGTDGMKVPANGKILTYVVGTDAVEDLYLAPRLDLEVKRVELKHLDRHPTTGAHRNQQQASGTAVTGKLQIVTVSGPEIVPFLPKSDFESATIKTHSGSFDALVRLRDTTLASAVKQHGSVPGLSASSLFTYVGNSGAMKRDYKYFPTSQVWSDSGKNLTAGSRFLVVSADLPEWARKQYKGIRVTYTGTWIASHYSSAGPWSAAFAALRSGAATGSGYANNDGTGFFNWLARPFSFPAILISAVAGLPQNPPWLKATKVYKRWDYDFIQPPSGMAAGLRIAQDWVPWQGRFSTVGDSVSGTNLLGRCINVAGALADCADMRALPKALAYDILRGRTMWELGAPARLDFGTAVGRVPTNPQDVIVQL